MDTEVEGTSVVSPLMIGSQVAVFGVGYQNRIMGALLVMETENIPGRSLGA